MKTLLIAFIASLTLPVFAADLTSISCAGMAIAASGEKIPVAVVFKKDESKYIIESYSTISNWAILVNPITSDSVIDGKRVIERSGDKTPIFSLKIQNPNQDISLATMTVGMPMDQVSSAEMVCILK